MGTFGNEHFLLILVSLTVFASGIPFLVLLNIPQGTRAYVDNNSVTIPSSSLLEGAINCSTPSIEQEGWLSTACRNYNEIPQDVPNSSEIQNVIMDNGNEIITITKGQLARANMPKVVRLSLQRCQIHIIEKGAFSTEVTTLMILILTYNKIEILDPDSFEGLTQLQHLWLGHNPIKGFEADKVFPPSLVSLTFLVLGWCHLDSLPDNVFDNLNLYQLYLDGNKFKTLNWHKFSKAVILEELRLYGNPWHCDCNTQFLIDYLQKRNLLDKENRQSRCNTSSNNDSLAGQLWDDIEKDKFACLPHIHKLQLVGYATNGSSYIAHDLDMEVNSSIQVGQDAYIKCTFSGYPKPQVKWKKYDEEIQLTVKSRTDTPILSETWTEIISNGFQLKHVDSEQSRVTLDENVEAENHMDSEEWRLDYTFEDIFVIKAAQKSDSGRYSCHISNFAGFEEKSFVLDFDGYQIGRSSGKWKIYLGVGTAVLMSCVIAVLFYLKCLQREIVDKTPIENSETTIDTFKFDQKLELDIFSDIFIDADNVLGSGNFGTVYKGRAKGNDVAIKQLNSNTSSATIKSLISELKLLCFIGTHKNVVEFIGAYTKEISNGILYIVTELCNNGSLTEFLRTKKLFSATKTNAYTSIPPGEFITITNLFRFSYEIASGMEYIAGKNVVHGDLSARNVLLDAKYICKIGDFGLARKLYKYQVYLKKSDEPLPWKWMSYESLTKMEFTSKSDVWSYGVTLWEIFTLVIHKGNVPFAGLHWSVDFAEEIRNGLHLPVPQNVPIEIYTKMLECWKLDGEDRPLFSELASFFRYLEEAHQDNSNLLESTATTIH